MKKWLVPVFLYLLAAGPAFADVSNEVIVGIQGDSTSEAKQTIGGVGIDVGSALDIRNSELFAQYTHFSAPLKDDDTPIDLRQFLQHPSSVFAGLTITGQKSKDSTNPFSVEEDTLGATVLAVGGEYFFPTNTGLFASVGGGGGTMKQKINGISQPDWDVSEGIYSFGVRQYFSQDLEFHLVFNGGSAKLERPGIERSTKKNVALLGVTGVIKNTVGLTFEIGGGKRTDAETGLPNRDFDVGDLNLAATVYVGKQLSFGLALEAEGAKQTGLLAGLEFKESTARATLSGTYWFSEGFGLQVPIYSETNEQKTTAGGFETKQTITNSGIGVFAAFRF